LQTILPATGQTGSGHRGSQVAYLYAKPSALATSQWPVSTLQYGPAATVTTYDEGNVGAVRQITSTYGLEGETLSVSGSTEPIRYSYDALYRLSTLTDAAGHVTSYFYNTAGYLSQVVYPGAQATPPTAPLAAGHADTLTFPSYDADGNLLSRVDGNNATTSYAYSDPESLLTGITYPAGTIGSVGLTYDAYGRRSAMTDGTGSQTYAYDDDDDLTSKTVTWTGLAAKTVAYGFYPNGSRQSMNADGHTSAYSYDGVGRMSSLTNDGALQASYAYQDNGWLQTKTLGNTDVTTYTRDAQGRLLDLANKTGAGATLSDFAVPAVGGYDGAGNKLTETATLANCASYYNGTDHYTYDYGQTANPQLNRSQVTQESSSTLYTGTKVYNYDQPSDSGPGVSTGPGNATHFDPYDQGYNSDNQLLNNVYYGYDGNGNSTTFASSALAFDPENRLTSYGTAQTDGYSADGLRAWKQTGGSTTRTYFLYDGSQAVCEYDSTGALTASNVFGADGLISRRTAGASVFYNYDDRGNAIQSLDGSGSSYYVFEYDVWGNRTQPVGNTPGPWDMGAQYGYYTDTETGLSLLTHRFYDPVVGRFLTRDPLGYGGGINLYGYCQNDPVNSVDPLGLWTGGIGIGGTGFVPGTGLGGGFDVGIVFDTTGTVGVTWDYYGIVGGGSGGTIGVELIGSKGDQPSPGGGSGCGCNSGMISSGQGTFVGGVDMEVIDGVKVLPQVELLRFQHQVMILQQLPLASLPFPASLVALAVE